MTTQAVAGTNIKVKVKVNVEVIQTQEDFEETDETSLRIRFNGKVIKVRKNALGLFCLTDIEKGWAQSGGRGGKLRNWKRNPDIEEMINGGEIEVISIHGSSSHKGTYGCERAAMLFASYCDIRFNLAIIDAHIENRKRAMH